MKIEYLEIKKYKQFSDLKLKLALFQKSLMSI
ncbi:MAG: Unknown protein [uncultured Sulfurovum sp.]|uniref:Uncharacterized protein n=1 Tax=uncultured Sulfurovum sp. TaxID=269237 RepID=A0A6S6S3H2_9BACT|nr:MAG: Unknown protein [uncultured Sulfurovum sp.]